MQHRYVGDVGDLSKFALLRAISDAGLGIGVLWYLNLAEETNADARHTRYHQLAACDQDLYERLQKLVDNGRRSVLQLEKCGLLPTGTCFYSSPVPKHSREAWFDEALTVLRGAEVVFLDPDNGLGQRDSKHASVGEIQAFLRRGQSVLVYHHFGATPR